MLLDWLDYLTLPATRDARRLGFVRDSVWLRSRSRRCATAWRPHLDRSRALIAEATAGLSRRRRAVVLGSGLLDDVPLRVLAESFEAVVLVDIVHPWPTRWAIRSHPNVSLLAFDLSGCADWLTGRRATLGAALPELCFEAETDLVISANVLSQLPILPLDRFEVLGTAPQGLGEAIVRAHLEGLARVTGTVCLITDIEQREIDRGGRVLDHSDLLHGVRVGAPDGEWDWDLAPFGEAARGWRLVHRVQGFRNWQPVI